MKRNWFIWLLCLLVTVVTSCSTDDADYDGMSSAEKYYADDGSTTVISGMWTYDGKDVGKGIVFWNGNGVTRMDIPCTPLLEDWMRGCGEKGWKVFTDSGQATTASYSTNQNGYSYQVAYYLLRSNQISFMAIDTRGNTHTLEAALVAEPICIMNEDSRTLLRRFSITALWLQDDETQRVTLAPAKALSFTGKY